MTREEAIDYFKNSMAISKDDDSRYHNEVLEFTIKVLEQEPNIWSLDDARRDFIYDVYKTLTALPTNDEANQIIDSFDRRTSGIGIKQELCKDCISRQAVLAIVGDSCLDLDSYADTREFCDEIKALPPVTPYPKIEKCEWIRYDYRTICPQNHDIDNPYWRIPEKRMNALKYCPYCGKEIEVTE